MGKVLARHPTFYVWVKLHGVPVTAFSEDSLSAIATKLKTSLMLDSYTSDMCLQSWGRSSYARVMIELQADVELKDTIVLAMPKIMWKGCYTCTNEETTNLVNNRANLSGSSFMNVKNSSTSNTSIIDKIGEFGQAILVDEAGIPLKKVECLGDYDSEDEVASVDNNMTRSMASERDVVTESPSRHSSSIPYSLGNIGASPKGDDATLYDDEYNSKGEDYVKFNQLFEPGHFNGPG
nr:hypothetical protein [Tanacetum cinerariifolium]